MIKLPSPPRGVAFWRTRRAVRFAEERGEQGPQASAVMIAGTRHA